MATGFPTKANWAAGDVLTASALDDLAGTVNLLSNASASTGQYLVSNAAGTSFVYNNNFAAGKNKIINGDFNVWQRGTSFSSPVVAVYTSDRWQVTYDGTGATTTVSQQTFTPGTAPVSGYEGQFFWRWAVSVNGTGNTFRGVQQKIEDVRTFAGQTVTISFWAKGDSARTLGTVKLIQDFGSGGSASVETTFTPSTTALTTSWQRITATVAVPSIAGKTIGTNSNLTAYIGTITNAASTFDMWGVQLEAGSVATSFQTASGSVGGELSLCLRYFNRLQPASAYNGSFGVGYSTSTTAARISLSGFTTVMRTAPSLTFSTASNFVVLNVAGNQTATALSTLNALNNAAAVTVTAGAASQTPGQGVLLGDNGTTAATIDFSAEY